MTSDSYNQAAFELIVSLRGGLPEKCDFCGQPFDYDALRTAQASPSGVGQLRWPVPEEAGEWTCSECLARWFKKKEPGYG
jgi:hypothetical protein